MVYVRFVGLAILSFQLRVINQAVRVIRLSIVVIRLLLRLIVKVEESLSFLLIGILMGELVAIYYAQGLSESILTSLRVLLLDHLG